MSRIESSNYPAKFDTNRAIGATQLVFHITKKIEDTFRGKVLLIGKGIGARLATLPPNHNSGGIVLEQTYHFMR